MLIYVYTLPVSFCVHIVLLLFLFITCKKVRHWKIKDPYTTTGFNQECLLSKFIPIGETVEKIVELVKNNNFVYEMIDV